MRFAACAAVVLIVAPVARVAAAPPRDAPTFGRDVAPIVYRACVACHRPEGDGPFSLVTYDDVRRRAALIAAVTKRRLMPPWKPAPESPEFIGARWLTDAEIDLFDAWLRAGTPEGDPAVLPPVPRSSGGWLHGQPDLILELPAYTLRADGADIFRNFVVTVPGRESRFVRALEFRPRSRAVHHANIRIDRTTASRRLDEADPEPGYEGVILRSADYPDGHFLGWTPGQAPPPASDDLSWRLDGGSDFVVQLHMRPTGHQEIVRPVLGLYFGARPARVPTMIRLGRQNLDIAAGLRDYRVTDSFTLPVDVEVHAIQPHAHYRARRVDAWATLPDGSRRPLLRIDDWDFNWQDDYRYASPFRLVAGTTISMEYTFDNSADNPRNPSRPPAHVSWGWQSADEMADVWLQVVAMTPADRERLQKDVDRKMLTEDTVGGEILVRQHPDYVALHNDVGVTYLKLGQPLKALEHFRAVTRLDPNAPAAWFNEGSALEQAGQRAEALRRYEQAIAVDPSYAPAYLNMGGLLLADGRIEEARKEYEHAVRAEPGNADARANLALVLAQQGDADAALAQMREALGLRSLRSRQLTSFVWLLAANADPRARRPDDARILAERMVEATGHGDADALDALAGAYAALGRFDDAIAAATEALNLVTGPDDDARASTMRERIDRYRRREAIVLQR